MVYGVRINTSTAILTLFSSFAGLLKGMVFVQLAKTRVRQRLHGTGSVWNRYEIGKGKPCVYTGPGGSGKDRIAYLIPNGFTYEGDPIWNRTVPVSNRSHANRADPYH